MGSDYQRFAPGEVELLADLLTEERWPYHAGTISRDVVRNRVAEGYYDNTAVRTFWIIEGTDRVGLIRLSDLDDDTPLFDLRIRAERRGRGLGTGAVTWLTAYLFGELPHIRRIEGTTRQDNHAMRRVFQRCGYAKEAHYREAWPGPGGEIHDAVGYAILRRDWATGIATPPARNDQELV